MKTLIFTFLIALISFSSQAIPTQFIGSWKGQGTYIHAGALTNCHDFELSFEATPTTFTFASGYRDCDAHYETFYPVTMEYRDGLLYFGTEIVGSYDGDILQATYRMPDGDSFRIWRMSMRKSGDHLLYEESRTMEGESTPLISFSGLLIKN